jgi:hypothetical protein
VLTPGLALEAVSGSWLGPGRLASGTAPRGSAALGPNATPSNRLTREEALKLA